MLFYKIFSLTFLSLLPIVNPIGGASVFWSFTKHFLPKTRNKIAYKVAIYSTILLLAVLFLGRQILAFFGLTLPFIRIAGGLMVSFTAWQMLNAKSKLSEAEEKEYEDSDEIAFFPLTLPITAGAGSIAIVVAITLGMPIEITMTSFIQFTAAACGILAMGIIIAICYRFSGFILHKLGTTGTSVVTRLFSFLLLAIGISVIWQGVFTLIIIAKNAK